MTARILVISGPVGGGKTTVAKLVVAQWGTPVAYLEGDEFWKFFMTRAPADSQAEARFRDGRIVVQALIASAARFARGGYDAIVDFTILPQAMPGIVAGVKDIPLDYAVICPSLETCRARIATRDDSDYKPYEGFHALFANLGRFEPHVIRDDTAEAGELAARIHASLAADELRVVPDPAGSPPRA
jgi:hypothetical protein